MWIKLAESYTISIGNDVFNSTSYPLDAALQDYFVKQVWGI